MLLDAESCNIFTSPIFVAGISGAMALVGVLLNQLSHLWSEKKRHERDIDLMSVESEVRKQESIQALQLQALKALAIIYQEITPNRWCSPNSDSDDAFSEVLNGMSVLIDKLDDYLKVFGYIIPDGVADIINDAIYNCNQGHWSITLSEGPAYEPSGPDLEFAQNVLNSLAKSVTTLKEFLGIPGSTGKSVTH